MENSPLPYFSEAQIEAMVPAASKKDDDDEGPYTAWRRAYTGIHFYRWFLNPEKETLRMIGYVFWDLDRIEIWDLKALCAWLKDVSPVSRHFRELQEMTSLSLPKMVPRWARVLKVRRSK
ncbi:unnamed protein product, partial [Clonostachys solani]